MGTDDLGPNNICGRLAFRQIVQLLSFDYRTNESHAHYYINPADARE
jgi:hypothetical protein